MSNNCLIVLGMHRSGTSCLTGTIEQYGVNLGEVFTENPFNKKGNRESAAVQALNNDVLAANGGAWDLPVDVVKWDDDHRARREVILQALKTGSDAWWGFKDPRVLLTLPFWLEGIDSPKFVGTYRHPYRVARSLNHRDRMPTENAYRLWMTYNRRLLTWCGQYQFGLVDFDVPDDEYDGQVARLLQELGLASRKAGPFFDPSLRHHSGEDFASIRLPAEVESVYQALRAWHAAL